tara:strand:- start:8889 stop:9641 length:753 start_codon:yes stop_codon:yes gene_type:complete
MIAGALPHAERHEQMAKAVKLFPMMKKRALDGFSDRRLSIVCYGPSLNDTWLDIRGPMMTVSGAHDYLSMRGCIPQWHVECDPREHKAIMLKRPSRATKYLMASCCHPKFWETLKGHDVRLWHLINGNDLETPLWVKENHLEGIDCMIGGGSTVGMRALEIAAAIGFRRFNIYGMDCSFTDRHHAGDHTGKRQAEITVTVGGKRFTTSPQMLQASQEMAEFILTMDAEVTMHGEGLMQETARLINERKAA